jgi:hypothetical protein
MQRAAELGSGGFICRGVQVEIDTTPRECYKPCREPGNDKLVNVQTAAQDSKMEIPVEAHVPLC